MTILHRCGTAFLIATLCLSMIACEKESLLLSGDQTKIVWKKSNEGWKTESVDIKVGDEWKSVGTPSGEYTSRRNLRSSWHPFRSRLRRRDRIARRS